MSKNSGRLVRYSVVTAAAAPTNLALYTWLLYATTIPAPLCNLLAATILTVPTFLANRAWVWGVRSDGTVGAEALKYWLFTLFNVTAGSALVACFDSLGSPDALLSITPLTFYTVMSAVRYLFLDHILFRPSAGPVTPMAASEAARD